ncbi:hypothetical protein [Streptomyces sp. JW3]|uniref:hypothetical protein n=1 Tax=Streptomyces sp. JW3 TaxID=3456955 RepID=UPI003FA49EFA
MFQYGSHYGAHYDGLHGAHYGVHYDGLHDVHQYRHADLVRRAAHTRLVRAALRARRAERLAARRSAAGAGSDPGRFRRHRFARAA